MSRVETPATVAEALAILRAMPRRYPPTHPPETTEQIDRDMALEQRAEAMAEERAWASDRDADWFADRYFAERGAW